MTRIELDCCEGRTVWPEKCLGLRCPVYRKVQEELRNQHPYVGTGYGSLYSEPDLTDIWNRIRDSKR